MRNLLPLLIFIFTPLFAVAQDSIVGTCVRITHPGDICPTFEVKENTNAHEAIGKIPGMNRKWADYIFDNSTERNWPDSLAFNAYTWENNPDEYLDFHAWKIADFWDPINSRRVDLIWIPAKENQHMPPGYRPDHDIYMVILPSGIKSCEEKRDPLGLPVK